MKGKSEKTGLLNRVGSPVSDGLHERNSARLSSLNLLSCFFPPHIAVRSFCHPPYIFTCLKSGLYTSREMLTDGVTS